MQKVLNISEAYSLALHSLALLASDNGRSLTTHQIASTLGASEAHLSKVMQRLTKAGFLNSSRGPGGGFALKKPPDKSGSAGGVRQFHQRSYLLPASSPKTLR